MATPLCAFLYALLDSGALVSSFLLAGPMDQGLGLGPAAGLFQQKSLQRHAGCELCCEQNSRRHAFSVESASMRFSTLKVPQV